MFRALSKTCVGILSFEAYVWFKQGTADMVGLDIPVWTHPEYECVQRSRPHTWTPDWTGVRGARISIVLRGPLIPSQVAKVGQRVWTWSQNTRVQIPFLICLVQRLIMQEGSLLSCWPTALGNGFQLKWILPCTCFCCVVLCDLGQVA